MPESFEDRLNATLQRKREVRDAMQRKRIEEALAARRAAIERADFERKMARTWHIMKTQTDEQIRLVNLRSYDLELVAIAEDRPAKAPALAARAIRFQRRPGTGRFNLVIQLARDGMVQYALDGKLIFSGKIASMEPADHDLIVNNVLDYLVSGIPITVRRNHVTPSRRLRTWRDAAD